MKTDELQQKMDGLRKAFPVRPSPSPFQEKKDTKFYSKAMVMDMMYELLDYVKLHDLDMDFEGWLNDKGLNGNGGDHENMYELYEEDLINSFIQ